MALPTRRGNEGSSRSSEVQAPASEFPRTVPLTVSLSGRAKGPQALQSVLALKTCEAPVYLMRHGPLQAWLEVTTQTTTVRVRPHRRKPRRHSLPVKRAQQRITKPHRAWGAANQARLLLYKLDRGARPDLDRSRRRPHAHSVTPIEDACRTAESVVAKYRAESNKGEGFFSSLSFGVPSDF